MSFLQGDENEVPMQCEHCGATVTDDNPLKRVAGFDDMVCPACFTAAKASKMSRTRVSWSAMKTRCLNKNRPCWTRYGGRGISFCARWKKYENFLKDMGERPAGHSLDRIDNNGNYNKRNCRWATRDTQANNCRSNILVTVYGVEQTLTKWCEHFQMSNTTVQQRRRRGWSWLKCFTEPLKPGRKRKL